MISRRTYSWFGGSGLDIPTACQGSGAPAGERAL